MAQPLIQALQVTAAGRDLEELHLRIHPKNKPFTVATCHETTALHLVQLKELVLRKTSYPVAAYIASPPAAVRGVISQAYWEETPMQMVKHFQTRNPDADIIAAHRMADFPPLGNTCPSTSAWSTGVVGKGGTTFQDMELLALREEVKQPRAPLSASTPTLPPISPPHLAPPHLTSLPRKKGGLMRAQLNP
ncbi:hypothetical protein MRX96_048911 [Rhipicephalus microplus]